MPMGEQAIGAIQLNLKSRDDIPQILRGLQHIYTTPELRKPIFAILEEVLPAQKGEGKSGHADPNNRPHFPTLHQQLSYKYERYTALLFLHGKVPNQPFELALSD